MNVNRVPSTALFVENAGVGWQTCVHFRTQNLPVVVHDVVVGHEHQLFGVVNCMFRRGNDMICHHVMHKFTPRSARVSNKVDVQRSPARDKQKKARA